MVGLRRVRGVVQRTERSTTSHSRGVSRAIESAVLGPWGSNLQKQVWAMLSEMGVSKDAGAGGELVEGVLVELADKGGELVVFEVER